MALFGKNTGGGLMDVIRCDRQDYLIWKWIPEGAATEGGRANAIRWGSSLRVKDGEVAVFVYPQDNGAMQDYIEGPYDSVIETKNLPVLSKLIGLAYNGDSPFQAEVYFINLAGLIQVRFGVPYFEVFDPRYMDYGVPTAVRGSFHFRIEDYKSFIKLHRLAQFDLTAFEEQAKDMVVREVKSAVINAPERFGVPVVQLERKITEINAFVEEKLKEHMRSDFGVSLTRLDISSIEPDKDSDGYKKLSAFTQNAGVSFVHKASAVKDSIGLHGLGSKNIKKTAKENNTGQEGAGGIAALGKKVSDGIGGLFGGKKEAGKATPPPLPAAGFYAVVGDSQSGPYTLSELKALAEEGTLQADTLVWKEGMTDWTPAGQTEVLKSIFS